MNELYTVLDQVDNHEGGFGVCTPPHGNALKEQLTTVDPRAAIGFNRTPGGGD